MRAGALLLLGVTGLTLGCATVHYGRMPETSPLVEELVPQASTKEDVLRLLGPPRGYGKADMFEAVGPRTIWYYESADLSPKELGVAMLLVFFDGEAYDGHMWFSSIEEWSRQKGTP